MVIAMGNISHKSGIPMKVQWMKHGEVDPLKPAVEPNPQVLPTPIEG